MFRFAKPIWLKDRENEINLAVSFETTVNTLQDATLRVAAATFYRVLVNGRFVAFGPARTAKGYARVDELALGAYDNGTGESLVRVEVVGYNCRSLSTCLQPSFLCAEIEARGTVIAYTGRDFTAAEMPQKEQRAERFSIQRHFTEVWELDRVDGERQTPAVVAGPPFSYPVWHLIPITRISGAPRQAHAAPSHRTTPSP